MWRGDAQALQATITERAVLYMLPRFACWLFLVFSSFFIIEFSVVSRQTYIQFAHCILWCACVQQHWTWTRWTLCSLNMFQCSNIKILSISPAEPLWDGIPCIYFHHPTERRKVYAVLKAVLSNLISNTQTPKQCYFRFPCRRPFDILIDWPVPSFSVSFSFSFFFHLLACLLLLLLLFIFPPTNIVLAQVVKYFSFAFAVGLWHTLYLVTYSMITDLLLHTWYNVPHIHRHQLSGIQSVTCAKHRPEQSRAEQSRAKPTQTATQIHKIPEYLALSIHPWAHLEQMEQWLKTLQSRRDKELTVLNCFFFFISVWGKYKIRVARIQQHSGKNS